MELKDKIIVVTGGSQGFGKELARSFINNGSKVIISSHGKESLELTANELSTDSFIADVTSFDDIKKLGEYVVQKYGKIDIWINNAGIQIAPSLIEEVDIKKLHHLFDVNFFGYFYGCQVALTQMKKQNSGLIININSTAGLDGKPEISAYSSSKFAIKGLTESIRKEVKDFNIQVYGIFPGGMQTDIYKEKYPEDIKEYMEIDTVAEKVINNLKSDNPEIDFIIKRPVK
ncbi:MAG: SDR family oxidoreductase [Candidatus Pacebacteria bacterium]|nr:SDR family oxidoreductase [Candidatus Paceibacterota bacterium]MCF7863010.1 SDR family oxidoreductase [Candidatus Paceibacterota bacterium]